MILRFCFVAFISILFVSCDGNSNSKVAGQRSVILKDTIDLSAFYYSKALLLSEKGDIENAKRYYKLAISKSKSKDAENQFKLYENLIGIYLFKNEYGNAIAVLNEYEKKPLIPESEQRLNVLSSKQAILIFAKQYEEALFVNAELNKLSQRLNDDNRRNYAITSQINILLELKRNEEARDLIKLLESDKNINGFLKSVVISHYGVSLFYQGDYENAIVNYKKALRFYKKSFLDGKEDALATQYANIAEAYLELKEYSNTRVYLDSFGLLDQNKVSNNLRKSVFKYELRLARALNIDNQRIEDLIDKTATSQEVFYKSRFDKELEALTEEKEKSEKLLIEKQKAEIEKLQFRTNAFVLVSIFLIILLCAFLYIWKQRKDFFIDSLMKQQRLLRAQMNPHFIFNVLSSIQNLMENDVEKASFFVTKFSRLLRTVLTNSMGNKVPVVDEVAVIKNYLDLQKLRFPQLFDYEIDLDSALEDEMICIPPMLIQPFVENAIEHGFKGVDYKGKIIVRLTLNQLKKRNVINCVIEDNGIGFVQGLTSYKKSASMLLITDFIKKTTGKELLITNVFDAKPFGTRVSFCIQTT